MKKLIAYLLSPFFKKRSDHPATLDSNSGNIVKLDERVQNLIAGRPTRHKKMPTILFLIHNMNTWYSISNLYDELAGDPTLHVIMASIQRSFPGSDGYKGESETSDSLTRAGINHMRIGTTDDDEIATILSTLAPDVIFRQAPWDNDIPTGFSTEKISFGKICYIPYYAINIVEKISAQTDFDFQSNQALHNHSWRIYCDSQHAYAQLCSNSLMRGTNARYFGHPKLDFIHTRMTESTARRIPDGTTNILWAPHHSIDKGWLSFGTFDVNYLDFLKLAEENGDIHIMLRPHPALFDYIKAKSAQAKNAIEDFLNRWNALDNTSIDFRYDYIESFEWSDIMVTDGISFIVEYPLLHKPLIFIENKNHAKFNHLGIAAAACSHRAENMGDVFKLIQQFQEGALENKSAAIEDFENMILPNKGQVHKMIAADIKANLQ